MTTNISEKDTNESINKEILDKLSLLGLLGARVNHIAVYVTYIYNLICKVELFFRNLMIWIIYITITAIPLLLIYIFYIK